MGNMIACPDCGVEASKSALRCPKCGGKMPAYKKRTRRIVGWVFSLILIAVVQLAFTALNADMARSVQIGERTLEIYKQMDIDRNQGKLDKVTQDFKTGKISAFDYKKKAVSLAITIAKLKQE